MKEFIINIFVFNDNPYLSAKYFYDNDPRRARKQIVELCQMMATIVDKPIRKKDGSLYKKPKSFKNHPATKWISSSQKNYSWCWEYLKQLINISGIQGCNNAMEDLKICSDWEGIKFGWHTKKCEQPYSNIFQSHVWYLNEKLNGKFKN